MCIYQYTVNQERVNEGEDRETIETNEFKNLIPRLINTTFSLENRLLQYFNIKFSDENNMAICERCSDSKGGELANYVRSSYNMAGNTIVEQNMII